MQPRPEDQLKALRAALEDGAETPVLTATDALVKTLQTAPQSVDTLDLQILQELRDKRQFVALRDLAEGFLSAGVEAPFVRLMLMQALIDTSAHAIAIDIGKRLLATPNLSKEDQAEATGLVGRAFKDLYLKASDPGRTRAQELLKQAIEHYQQSFEASGKTSIWAAENLVVLLARAGTELDPDQKEFAKIKERFGALLHAVPEKKRAYWHWAGLAILHASDQDWEKAATAAERALSTSDVTAFQLAGTLRQFKALVELQGGGEDLIVPLQAGLLRLTYGRIELSANQLQSARDVPASQYEKIFGDRGPVTHAWLRQFLDAGASVGLVSRQFGHGVGTCFLVAGEDLHPNLAGEKLVLTNDHVVSEHPGDYRRNPPLRPEKAEVSFEVGGGTQFAIREIIWSSSAQYHDACLIRLAGYLPKTLEPLRLAHFAPDLRTDPVEEVYVIGHPGGRRLSYSMQNNDLIDHDCPPDPEPRPGYIHYFTPTSPGSSGSPAFNGDMDVIGLHHAGGKDMARLKGAEGTYAANEAIWIQSIIQAIATSFEKGETRWHP